MKPFPSIPNSKPWTPTQAMLNAAVAFVGSSPEQRASLVHGEGEGGRGKGGEREKGRQGDRETGRQGDRDHTLVLHHGNNTLPGQIEALKIH